MLQKKGRTKKGFVSLPALPLSLSVVVILRYYNNVDNVAEERENDLFGIVILYVALFTPFLHPTLPSSPLCGPNQSLSPLILFSFVADYPSRPSRGGGGVANPKDEIESCYALHTLRINLLKDTLLFNDIFPLKVANPTTWPR